ncbi:asparagine synthase (glutamine-hydrolyzing) [Flavobacterium sp. GT3R68]|uniref:asparagine synthase (glutamine-hydrolyzing) n=1 Tax=Flavobacterium sp. GT3R68 TaxID=2594437 RepID=UPI000F8938B7|nr:asparagine synthase (glutamine-hydrolyzing) [Flavobacterium sp. GT3R68]RTY92259.1 asparagine synthase (glutamine-hydrolyzing) [Flavobacterium sp. GSN2]TRW92495.1 asparagine synthase (glutamine-hydrolyzing) [Flavobacterium sp. GT3R68]
MCGIAGILGKQSNSDTILAMLEAQKHRGPDATNVWNDDKIVLGHNRLSIIDLSDEANQPMISNCGDYRIIFNGEIYNYLELKEQLKDFYQFKTHSDTEVLLAAYLYWGNEALEKLNGMFSFVIWDAEKEKLFAARDRFGVKPFYYTVWENQLYFASEIKTLFAAGIPKIKNQKVWANYFVYGTYGMPYETFWESIHQLPGGHFMEVSFAEKITKQTLHIQKWYDFPKRIAMIDQLPEAELKIQYESLLKDAIQLRFRADVPLGMNVSGGLDSSTLISLVHENLPSEQSIEAFTFYTGNENYDELPWVHELMEKTQYPLHKVLLTQEAIPKLIEEVSYYQDEPFGGFPTLAYSLLFREARANGIKVILDGQGMDEAWAGYDYYHNNSNNIIQGLTTSPVRPEALTDGFKHSAQKEIYDSPFDNALQNLQYRDLFYTKIPRALRFNDRISMMHSTELREPFLDYRLVELAFAQKASTKLHNGQTKWLLRDLVREKLGDAISLAPKRALQTPQREWIAKELNGYVSEKIEQFSQFTFVNATQTTVIWQNYCKGNQDNSFFIWQWVNSVVLDK